MHDVIYNGPYSGFTIKNFFASGLHERGGVVTAFKEVKNDLIAELKLSHNIGGISKLKQEQQKIQEAQEREKYKRFLAKFTMENFLEKVRFNFFLLIHVIVYPSSL